MSFITVLIVKSSVVLILTLITLLFLRKNNPRWRIFACEACACVLLILPATALIPFSLELRALPPKQAATTQEPVVPQASAERYGTLDLSTPVNIQSALAETEPQKVLAKPTPKRMTVAQFAGCIYGTGIIVLLGMFVRCRMRLVRFVNHLEAPDTNAITLFNKIQSEFDLKKRAKLLVTQESMSPFCFGWRHIKVVIPKSILLSSKPEVLRLVLRHELSHVANQDLLRLTFMNVMVLVYWFHPLAWFLRRFHLSAIEELGDRIASENESGRAIYRSTLAKLSLSLHKTPPLPSLALGIFGPPEILRRLRCLGTSLPYEKLRLQTRVGISLCVITPLTILLAMGEITRAERTTTSSALSWINDLTEDQRKKAHHTLDHGLDFLLEHQSDDGSVARTSDASHGQNHEAGVTAMAGMVFLLNGGSEESSAYHGPMLKALEYVLACQSDSGWFHTSPNGTSASIYHQAISTWFLAHVKPHMNETMARKVDQSLEAAVNMLIRAQKVPKVDSARGGWRYTLDSRDSDLSCSAWALRALFAAKQAGISVPDEAIEKGIQYIIRLRTPGGSFQYVAGPTIKSESVPRAAMGLFCLQLAGHGDAPSAEQSVQFLINEIPKPQPAYEFYGIFWGASAMWARGGDDAKRFADWMIPYLSEKQEKGQWKGSLGNMTCTLFGLLALSSPDTFKTVTNQVEEQTGATLIPYDPKSEAIWEKAFASMDSNNTEIYAKQLNGNWLIDHERSLTNVKAVYRKNQGTNENQDQEVAQFLKEFGDLAIVTQDGISTHHSPMGTYKMPRLKIMKGNLDTGIFIGKPLSPGGGSGVATYQIKDDLWTWYPAHPTIDIPPIVFRRTAASEFESKLESIKQQQTLNKGANQLNQGPRIR